MIRFQQGSRQAFEELFSRYRNPVYGYFRRRLNDSARAEELAQETFIVILRGVIRYEPRAKFRTYIYSVALKMLWSERRKGSRGIPAAVELGNVASDHNPLTAIWIRDALAGLDSDHREVLMLREYEQLTYDEIAELLRIPLNTVRSRLFRARQQLKSLLDGSRQRDERPGTVEEV